MARGSKQTTRTNIGRTQTKQSLFSGPADIVHPRLIFIVAVAALTVIGLVMVFSSSTIQAMAEGSSPTAYVTKQAAITLGSALMCLAIAGLVPYVRWLDRLLLAVWSVVVILLLLTALIGTVGLGAKRWIVLGPVNFQPSEFAKAAIVLVMARLLSQYRSSDISFEDLALRCAVGVLLPVAIIFIFQSDLGTTIICFVGIMAVLWIGEVPKTVFWGIIILLVVLGMAAILLTGYRGSRMSFLNPRADPYGDGYQLIHSFYAFGEGGLFGVGLGNSREKYLYLPEAETDFIFAIIGEEMGLAGALVIVGLFCAVLYSGLKIARNAPDLFGGMIAGGCTLMLVFQAFLNIGCVLGMLPTTGKPLPFISSGGSAMIGSYLLVGLILSVSLGSGADAPIFERRREDLRVVRSTSRPARSGRSGPPSPSGADASSRGRGRGRGSGRRAGGTSSRRHR